MKKDIKKYDSYRKLFHTEHSLPENVRQDLNLDELCEKMDYTSSCIGRQYLYYLLCTDKTSTVSDYESFITQLQQNTTLRTQLTESLKQMNKPDAYSIADILSEKEHHYSQNYLLLLQVCRWLPAIFLTWMFLDGTSALPFILFLSSYIVNSILHFKQKSMLACYYFSIPQLYRLLLTAQKLCRTEAFANTNREIHNHLNKLKSLEKKLNAFKLGITLQSDSAMLFFLISELLNIFTLYAAINVVRTFKSIHSQRKEIEEVFRFVGFLDVLCSLSFYRENLPYWCIPSENKKEETLYAREVYHPLIDNCVPNTVSLTGKSMLITGSNMSGKTSFIRTIAVNLLVGKTLNTCFSKEFRIDLSRNIHSVIHTEDDILNGKSYFLKEVENVKEAIQLANQGKFLLIFDELFKGTNTMERIAINYAVFLELAQTDHIILASTHDKELTSLLHEHYNLYHFSETITGNQLIFDYKLKEGVSQEGNAIKLLKLYHYPESIINAAENIRSNSIDKIHPVS